MEEDNKPYLDRCPVCKWPIKTHAEEKAHAMLHLLAWSNVSSQEGQNSGESSGEGVRDRHSGYRRTEQNYSDDSAS